MKSTLVSIKKIIEKEVGRRIDTKDRYRDLTYARSVYCKVGRDLYEANNKAATYTLIGKVIGRTHATVLHNIEVVFPFAIQQRQYKYLYETLTEMFLNQVKVDSGLSEEERFSFAERIILLEKENAALQHKLDLVLGNNNFNSITNGLSDEEMAEVYERLDLMVRSIKNRVYY
jgi:hypothetical protein